MSLGSRMKEAVDCPLPGGIHPVTVTEKRHGDAQCYEVVMMLVIEVVVVMMALVATKARRCLHLGLHQSQAS